MRLLTVLAIVAAAISAVAAYESQALFVKRDAAELENPRRVRQANAEEMVQNILHWLQGVYKQSTRKTRQENLRGYLPPGNTPDKPRPFQPVVTPPAPTYQPRPTYETSNTVYGNTDVSVSGYPLPGPSPRPPFVSPAPQPSRPTESPQPTYQPSQPTYQPSQPAQPTYQPSQPTYQPSQPTYQPSQPTYDGSQSNSGYSTSRPTQQPFPTQPPTPGYPSPQPTVVAGSSTSTGSAYETGGSNEVGIGGGYRPTSPTPRPFPTVIPTSPPSGGDDDSNHPPHIHEMNVQCSKDMMTIDVEFNRQYDGIIYSKGYYSNPECRYVQPNSGQTKYSFTVSLNSCGTEFINAFDSEGQSYLENVLVIQNEPNVQEIWDRIRSVRCLWAGNIRKELSGGLSVGMLNQEIATFSGDTAMATLDIQTGRGPFSQPASGLIKIGETMTLVISVTGDAAFDIQVRDCRARDAKSETIVMLTDDNGCVLKPKLFGAFQKTRETQNTGASIIAYAYFNAFRFPDVMDLIMECNIELCKTNCNMCDNPDQKIEPGRRRRDLFAINNDTLTEPVTVGKALHVFLAEDISDATARSLEPLQESICMSISGFVISISILLIVLFISCIFSAFIWLRLQKKTKC